MKLVKLYFILLCTSLISTACSASGEHQPLIQLSNPSKDTISDPIEELVKYSDVKPIFEVRCGRCHPAWSQPNWLDYQQAHQYAMNGLLFERALSENPTMPLIGSPEESQITAAERDLIRQWIADGALKY